MSLSTGEKKISSTRKMPVEYRPTTNGLYFSEDPTTILSVEAADKLKAMRQALGLETGAEEVSRLMVSEKRDQVAQFLWETQEFMTKLLGKDRKNENLLSELSTRMNSINVRFRELNNYVKAMSLY